MPWTGKKRYNLYYIYEQEKKENPMPIKAKDAVFEYLNKILDEKENENKNQNDEKRKLL